MTGDGSGGGKPDPLLASSPAAATPGAAASVDTTAPFASALAAALGTGSGRARLGAGAPLSRTPRSRRPISELQDAIQKVFDRWDVDRSGMLSLDEFRNGITSEANSPDFRDDPTVRVVLAAAANAGGTRLFASPEAGGGAPAASAVS